MNSQLFLIVNSSLVHLSERHRKPFIYTFFYLGYDGVPSLEYLCSCAPSSSLNFLNLFLHNGSTCLKIPHHHDNQKQTGLSCFLSSHLTASLLLYNRSNLKTDKTFTCVLLQQKSTRSQVTDSGLISCCFVSWE